jgi:hypothetical protein
MSYAKTPFSVSCVKQSRYEIYIQVHREEHEREHHDTGKPKKSEHPVIQNETRKTNMQGRQQAEEQSASGTNKETNETSEWRCQIPGLNTGSHDEKPTTL